MRDVTEQLVAYFDATVERVTAEDVLAGADVRSQNGLEPTRAPRLRPAWVLAASFLATMVLIGGGVGIVLLLEGDSTQAETTLPPVADGGDGVTAPWVVLIAAGVLALVAVAGLAWRRSKIVKEQDMQTLERPEVEVSQRPRSPAVTLVLTVLLVVVVVLAGWLFVENRSLQSDLDDGLWWPAESELTSGQQQIFEVIGPEGLFVTALRAEDVEATLSLYSPEAVWAMDAGTASMEDGSLRSAIEQFFDWGWGHEAEIVGVTIHGRNATIVMDTAVAGSEMLLFTFDEAGLIVHQMMP